MTFFVNFNATKALRISFTIFDRNLEFIVDSGASCCIIDKRCIPSNIHINTNQTLEVNGVNGKTSTLGYVDTFLEYQFNIYPIRFHVMEVLPSNVIGLIGTNFLNKFNAKIDFAKMTMKLSRPKFEQNFIIPARTEIVAYVETNFEETCVVLNEEVQPNVFIGNSISQPLNGKIPVRMLNTKNKPARISNLNPIIKKAKDYVILETKHTKNKTDRILKLLEELNLNHLPQNEKEQITKICVKYSDLFCLKDDTLTTTKILDAGIRVKKDIQPVYSKPYRLPHAQKQEVEEQIKKMTESKIIEKSVSAWNSPILLVPKKSAEDKKKWRLVVDYRKVNTVIEDDKFPLPNIDEIIDALSGAKYFTHLDLSQGYYQCSLRPEDRPVTAFSTPSGQYQMTRLPMGLKVSPSIFSRLMTTAMSGLNGEQCLIYLDDLIVFGRTLEQHNRNLINIFERLKQVNLKLNPLKCNFLQEKLIYLGHYISSEGIKPDPSKIEIIKSWPKPTNADEVKRFVAFANYYRKHIKNFAYICAPLNQLTRKNVLFDWTEDCEKSFDALRNNFVRPPILDFPDFGKDNTFNLHTDASGYAIGAVLSNKNGKPIAFASKMLNKAEKNYSTVEKELLAVVWGVRHFRPYLYGRKFVVYTDHRPLVYLFSLTDPSSRLTKFRLALEEYNFDVIYKRGSENVIADALSRISISDLKHLTADTMIVTTRSKNGTNNLDEKLSTLRTDQPEVSQPEYIELKVCQSKKELEMSKEEIIIPQINSLVHLRGIMTRIAEFCRKIGGNTFLIMKQNDESAIKIMKMLNEMDIKGMPKIIPMGKNIKEITDSKEKWIITNDFHVLPTASHAGIRKTIKNIKEKFIWKGMDNDVKTYIQNCHQCQTNKQIAVGKT